MTINTKYDLEDNLYFLHKGKVRYSRPKGVSVETVVTGDEQQREVKLISYWFKLDEKSPSLTDVYENQVFKRRADLIKSLQ